MLHPAQVVQKNDIFGWTQDSVAEPCSWDLVSCSLAPGWSCMPPKACFQVMVAICIACILELMAVDLLLLG